MSNKYIYNRLKKVFANVLVIVLGGISFIFIVLSIIFAGLMYEKIHYRVIVDSQNNCIYDKKYNKEIIDKGQALIREDNKYYAYKKGWYIFFDEDTDEIILYLDNKKELAGDTYKALLINGAYKNIVNSGYKVTLLTKEEEMSEKMREYYYILRKRKDIYKSQGIF